MTAEETQSDTTEIQGSESESDPNVVAGLDGDVEVSSPSAATDDGSGSGSVWPWALFRTALVLAVAGAGYWAVVPTSHIVRARLSKLVITDTGLAAYPGKPTNQGERPATTGGLSSMEAAAKAHPNQTGLYLGVWSTKANPNDGLVVVAFVVKDTATATKVHDELVNTQLSAKAFQTGGLTRTAQYAPSGIPGARGALFSSAASSPTKQEVGTVVWQHGRAVGLVQLIQTANSTPSPEAATTTAARAEAANLDKVEPGFTLAVTSYPTTASIVWIAGSALATLAIGAGPVAMRRRRERLDREYQEELARTIRVGGQTIVKRRREG